MSIDEAIAKEFPDMPLPARVEIKAQLNELLGVLAKHDPLRQSTLVTILKMLIVGGLVEQVESQKKD